MLTPSEYGIVVVLFSFVYIFNVPGEAIQNLFSRITSVYFVEKKEGKIKFLLKRGIIKGLLYSFLIFIALVALSFSFSLFLSISLGLILLTMSTIFFFILSPIPRGVLQGKKQFFIFGSSLILESLLRLGLSVLFVLLGWRAFGAIFGLFVGLALGFICSLWFAFRCLPSKEEAVSLQNLRISSAPFFITTLVVFLMLSIDILLARRFFDPDLAGKYAVLSTLGKIIFLGTASFGKTMFANVSERFEQKRETSSLFKKSFFITLISALLALIFYWIIPYWIVLVAFGRQYIEIAPLLLYAGIALSLLSFSYLILLYWLAIRRMRSPWILFVFLGVEIALLTLFHQSLQAYLIALIVSQTIMFIGSLFLVKR
jgi:O-antigen/teichoic acid export membrane protein